MNELQVININGVSCYEKDGTAYLKLENVARGLGFTKTETKKGTEYTTIRWERVFGLLDEIGFDHKWAKDGYLPENIFYRLAMKAKNETAEKFQDLVADEIIPSIRKTGGYIAGQENLSDAELMAKALLVAQRTIDERNKQIEVMKPKALFADAVSASETSILIGDLAKLLKQNGVDIGQNRLFRWLRDEKYLMKSGESRNVPTQRAMDLGLFEIKETPRTLPSGAIHVDKTPKVTGKGQTYFINKFLNVD